MFLVEPCCENWLLHEAHISELNKFIYHVFFPPQIKGDICLWSVFPQ